MFLLFCPLKFDRPSKIDIIMASKVLAYTKISIFYHLKYHVHSGVDLSCGGTR